LTRRRSELPPPFRKGTMADEMAGKGWFFDIGNRGRYIVETLHRYNGRDAGCLMPGWVAIATWRATGVVCPYEIAREFCLGNLLILAFLNPP
jgi:hypothetical protein